MSSKNAIAKSILGFSMPTWINAIVGFLAVPLVTRMFTPEVLGKFNLFNTYGYILCCVALAGLNQGFMRFFNEASGRNNVGGLYKLGTMLALISTLCVGLFIFAFGYKLSYLIAGEYNIFIPLCLVVLIFSYTVLNMVSSLYRMQNAVIAYGAITVLMNLCGKISYAGAIWFYDMFSSAIFLFAFSYLIVAVVFGTRTLIAYKGKKARPCVKDVPALLKYSLPLMPVLFIAQLNTALPQIAINEYLDYSQVGIYAAAYSIVGVISIVQSGINVFWAPFVFENYADRPRLLSRGHLFVTFIMSLFGLFIVLFQDLVFLLIGKSYRAGQQFFALLLFSSVCYTVSETTGIGINISKKTYLNAVVYILTVATTLVACFLLIPKLGLLGAAISVAMSALIMLIVKTIVGGKYYKVVEKPVKSFSAPLLFLLAIGINTAFFNGFWIRTVATAISIVVLCIIYKREFASLFKIIMEVIKKSNSSPINS
jgi:O-antigen/teichoic acid export membrane protein